MTDDLERPSAIKPRPARTSYQQIVDAWHRRPISNRVGSQRFRRRLVIATYAGWLVIAAITKVISLTSGSWFGPFILLTFANSVVQVVWLSRRTYINTPQLADAELDERLVQIRNRAFRTAYRVFVPVALLAMGLSFTALKWQPDYNGYTNSMILLLGVGLLAGTLPTVIVAWREPDPQTSEEST
jgi:uncharacterized membrane protein